jgi:hypothetical protein
MDDLVRVLKNGIGYTDDELVKKIANALFKSVPRSASSNIKNLAQQYGPKVWKFIKDNPVKIALGAAAIYWLFFYDDANPLPDCLKNMATESEINEIGTTNKYEFVRIAKTGNQEIDYMGGANFYLTSPNKVVLGNGDEGTWSIIASNVKIVAGQNSYDIPCPVGKTAVTGGGGPVVGKSTYRQCNQFPFQLYCSATEIKEIQECLGLTADGKFGPLTRNALKNAGYGDGTVLTLEIYNQIRNKCGKENVGGTPSEKEVDKGSDYLPSYIPTMDWLDK